MIFFSFYAKITLCVDSLSTRMDGNEAPSVFEWVLVYELFHRPAIKSIRYAIERRFHMIYSKEVEEMCVVARDGNHG